jgi:hypothetical protein
MRARAHQGAKPSVKSRGAIGYPLRATFRGTQVFCEELTELQLTKSLLRRTIDFDADCSLAQTQISDLIATASPEVKQKNSMPTLRDEYSLGVVEASAAFHNPGFAY